MRWTQLFKCNLRSVVHFQLFQFDDWQQIVKLFHFEENAIDLYYYLIWILGRNMLLGLLISCTCHSYLISGFLQDVVSLLWQLCVFLVWTELWIRYKLCQGKVSTICNTAIFMASPRLWLSKKVKSKQHRSIWGRLDTLCGLQNVALPFNKVQWLGLGNKGKDVSYRLHKESDPPFLVGTK